MDFLKIDYAIFEIYFKEEKSSNENEDMLNENSKFVSVAKIILEENPKLSNEDLNIFMMEIKKIFNNKSEIIKNTLKENNALKEFDECFNNDEIITKICEFISKYNINDDNSKIFALLLNISTIIDYITIYVKNPELYNITQLVLF